MAEDASRRAGEAVRIWLRSLAVLLLTAGAFLPCLLLCAGCWVGTTILKTLGKPKADCLVNSITKCVVIMAGSKSKALHQARIFKAEGYKTIVCEVDSFVGVASAWSCNVDIFYHLPDPTEHPVKYVEAVLSIVKSHNPQFFIPMEPRHVKWDAEVIAKIDKNCISLAINGEIFETLDNKYTFCQMLKKLDLRAPLCEIVTDVSQVKKHMDESEYNQFVLKPIDFNCRFRSDIHIPTDPDTRKSYLESRCMSEDRPFVIQNRLDGPEYSSCTLVLDGKVIGHAVSTSSAVHQTQDSIEHDDIDKWVFQFIERYPGSLTGWLTFDFMQSSEDEQFYPIECNPRISSIFILFQEEDKLIQELEWGMLFRGEINGCSDASKGYEGKQIPYSDPKSGHINGYSSQINGYSGLFNGCSGQFNGCTGPSCPITDCSGPTHGYASHTNDNKELIHAAKPSCKQIYWFMNEMWVLLSNMHKIDVIKEHLHIIRTGKEANFDIHDSIPFLVLNFVQMPVMILKNMIKLQPFGIVDYCCSSLKS